MFTINTSSFRLAIDGSSRNQEQLHHFYPPAPHGDVAGLPRQRVNRSPMAAGGAKQINSHRNTSSSLGTCILVETIDDLDNNAWTQYTRQHKAAIIQLYQHRPIHV